MKKKIECYSLIKDFGGPKKKGNSNGYSLIHTLARLVARYPSSEVYATLILLHQSLNSFWLEVLPQQKEEAEKSKDWLIGALRGKSAGGFNSVESLNKFLSQDPNKITPQRLITGLCALATCIGYRVRQKGYEGPFLSLNDLPEEKRKKNYLYYFLENLDKFTKDNIVERLSLSFHNDQDEVDTINHNLIESKHAFYKNNDNYLSEASEAEEGELIPEQPANAHFLKLLHDDETLTWWGEAFKSNVDIRNHFSGTTAITMGVFDSLLNKATHTDILEKENHQGNYKIRHQAYTQILMTNMLRGNYHSLIEAMVGAKHYYAQYVEKNRLSYKMLQGKKVYTGIPFELEQEGLYLLVSGIDKNIADGKLFEQSKKLVDDFYQAIQTKSSEIDNLERAGLNIKRYWLELYCDAAQSTHQITLLKVKNEVLKPQHNSSAVYYALTEWKYVYGPDNLTKDIVLSLEKAIEEFNPILAGYDDKFITEKYKIYIEAIVKNKKLLDLANIDNVFKGMSWQNLESIIKNQDGFERTLANCSNPLSISQKALKPSRLVFFNDFTSDSYSQLADIDNEIVEEESCCSCCIV